MQHKSDVPTCSECGSPMMLNFDPQTMLCSDCQKEANRGPKILSDMFAFGEEKTTFSITIKAPRRFRKWQWFKDNQFRAISKHWTREEALENTPTEPGTYYLCFGSHGGFIRDDTLVVA